MRKRILIEALIGTAIGIASRFSCTKGILRVYKMQVILPHS